MRKGSFTEEQIIGVLKEHAAGMSASDLCRKHDISDATFYKWRSRYGGMDISDARRMSKRQAELSITHNFCLDRSSQFDVGQPR
ncbi:putative transposase [Bradyrhizobium sp. USDA 4501]